METIVISPTLQGQAIRRLTSATQARQGGAVKENIRELTSDLSNDNPWAVRRAAARKLGDIRDSRALAKLLEAVSSDPFWMVRQEIVQALEMIGDARALPALEAVAEKDAFAVVRGYAAKAIERLGSR